jgi:ubiquinone/menaquinone biosynthesis C-methylase UbiE
MNVFLKPNVAKEYDSYYKTDIGKKVNDIEEKLITEFLKEVPKAEMLELGCGTGHWTNIFVNQGFEVTAMDISDEMLKYATEKKIKAKFIKADSRNIPFPDNSFSAVSFITMIEFINDQNKVFNEIYRVLKPNGHLIMGCLNKLSELGKNKENDDTFRDAKFLSKEELENKLTLFGAPKMKFGVYFSPTFEILDNISEIKNTEPAFIAAMVQKTK